MQMPANQVIYGVEAAHAYTVHQTYTVHQIIDAVLTQHLLITSWAVSWEYL
jgi:CHASE2 domain-containing sensor protein